MSWKPENTVITNIGLQMLAKAQVGIGKLEVTKVVTTDTISTISANKALTGDSTQISFKQECEIMNTYGGEVYDAEEEQNAGESRITARVSNESVSNTGTLKPYSIHQIIVFMRLTNLSDPDADMGEVPYMIAQSEGTSDNMPDFSENPVAINYDLYILHSGVAQITVKNDVSGYTPKETFDAVVKEIKTSIETINKTKAGENTSAITTFKPWTPVYEDKGVKGMMTVDWSKTDGTTEMSGKKTAERFNQYGNVSNNIAIGENSHVENKDNVGLADNSHLEGSFNYNASNSPNSHLEGEKNSATLGRNQHIEGSTNQGQGINTHIEGQYNKATVSNTDANNHIEGKFNVIKSGGCNHVEGSENTISGTHNSVKGRFNTAKGAENDVGGLNNSAEGTSIHMNGNTNYASSDSGESSIVGRNNKTYATSNCNVSGEGNNIRTTESSKIGGKSNDVQSVTASNVSGTSNTLKGTYNSNVSGNENTSNGGVNNDVISGSGNTATATTETILSGNDNTTLNTIGSIVTGEMNSVSSETLTNVTYNCKNSSITGDGNVVKALLNSVLSGKGNKVSVLDSIYNHDAVQTTNCHICGDTNTVIGCINSHISGSSNTLKNVQNSFVAGSSNTVASYLGESIVAGKNNTFKDSTDNLYTLSSILCVGEGNTISNETYPETKGTLGKNNEVSGAWSYAFGFGLKATSFNQTVVGKYNTPEEANFIVGCGSADDSRDNAFWVSRGTAYAKNFETSGVAKANRVQGTTVYVGQRNILDIIDAKIAALVDGAPETLDTLKEIAEALSTAEDVIEALQTYSVQKKFFIQSTELVSSNGVCTWGIPHGFTMQTDTHGTAVGGYIIQIMDNSGNVVNCNITNTTGVSYAKFSSASNISANSYKAIVIGNSSTNAE